MYHAKNQAGLVVAEALLLVVAVLAVGFVGWRVYSANQSSDKQLNQSASSSDKSAKAEVVVSAPQINSVSDLDKASQALDQLDVETYNSQDSAKLASQASAF